MTEFVRLMLTLEALSQSDVLESIQSYYLTVGPRVSEKVRITSNWTSS